MKVIFATDFSKASEVAENFALAWSKLFIAELHLIHAFTLPIVDPMLPMGYMELDAAPIIKSLEEKLSKKGRELQENGVLTKTHLYPGDLLMAIEELTKEIGKEDTYLILGKSTKNDFLDNLLGSTSASLLNRIEIPVIVFPEDAEVKLPRKVAYATELEYDEKNILTNTTKLCQRLKAELNLCHVNLDLNLDIVPDDQFIEEIKSLSENPSLQIEFVKAESLKEGIKRFIVDSKSDLLVLASHKRNFLDQLIMPSKSKTLLNNISIPMLIFHF